MTDAAKIGIGGGVLAVLIAGGSSTTAARSPSEDRVAYRHSASLGAAASPTTVSGVDVEAAIRTRRTHKAYRQDPVSREVLDELFELATWAPNHNLTVPWRFRVVGPTALERLKEAAGPEAAAKLDRAPTLIVVSSVETGDAEFRTRRTSSRPALPRTSSCSRPTRAGSAATGARPGVLRDPTGLEAVGVPDDERFVGLLHLGEVFEPKPAPERPDTGARSPISTKNPGPHLPARRGPRRDRHSRCSPAKTRSKR